MQDGPASLVLATVDVNGALLLDRQAPARIHLRPGQPIQVTVLYHESPTRVRQSVHYALDCTLGGQHGHEEASHWSVPFRPGDVEGTLVASLASGRGGLLEYKVEANCASGPWLGRLHQPQAERLTGRVRVEVGG